MAAELSVIVLSYNQFTETTGPCLQSLSAEQGLSLDIIVVDNGSDKETVARLKEAADRDPRVRLLLLPENCGYAAGNNKGAKLAAAEYIMLLNSDTVVPADTLGRVVKHLQEAERPCLVGPVTNAAGNEQQIYIREGSDQSSVLAQGAQWCSHADGSVVQTDQLSFFCVAMAVETYTALGGLDESFGLGFYEDADFCCRASGQGISLQVLEPCFVFHQGSASFSRMPDSVKKLLAVNRKRFRARHGRAEGQHVRWKNYRQLEQYLAAMTERTSKLCYLFDNRLARARQLTPNSPLKKMVYGFRLRTLVRKRYKIS